MRNTKRGVVAMLNRKNLLVFVSCVTVFLARADAAIINSATQTLLPPTATQVGNLQSGLPLGVTITGTPGTFTFGNFGNIVPFVTGNHSLRVNTGVEIAFKFSSPITAVSAASVGLGFDNPGTFSIAAFLNGNPVPGLGQSVTNAATASQFGAFVGISNSLFDEFRLTGFDATGGVYFVDNLAFVPTTVVAVPEPASLAVFTLGAIGIAVRGRSRRRMPTSV